MNLADPSSNPRKFANLPVNALSAIVSVPDTALPRELTVGLRSNSRDWTLIGVATTIEAAETVLILSDDEELINDVHRIAYRLDEDAPNLFAMNSMVFIGKLYQCRAISREQLAEVAAAETSHAYARGLTGELLLQKIARIKDTVTQAALDQPREPTP